MVAFRVWKVAEFLLIFLFSFPLLNEKERVSASDTKLLEHSWCNSYLAAPLTAIKHSSVLKMKNKLVSAFINSCHHVVWNTTVTSLSNREKYGGVIWFVQWWLLRTRSATHRRDGTADEQPFCTAVQALLRLRTGQSLWYCPQHHGCSTKPLPHFSSLELGDHNPGPRKTINSSVWKIPIPKWLMLKTYLPDTDLPGGSILSPHVMRSYLLCHGMKEWTPSQWALFPLTLAGPVCCLVIWHNVDRKLQRHSTIQREDGV